MQPCMPTGKDLRFKTAPLGSSLKIRSSEVDPIFEKILRLDLSCTIYNILSTQLGVCQINPGGCKRTSK